MDKEDSLVSVLIPSYNNAKSIERALCSALNQTYKNIEIIICDDNSKDETINIIKKFNDKRIHLFINKKNLGMVGNWNNCLLKASGDYLQFLHGDDELDKECIEKKVKVMNENPNAVICISSTNVINNDNKVILKRRLYKCNKIIVGNKFAKKAFFIGNIYGEPSTIFIRKSAIEKTGLYSNNIHYCCDLDMSMRLSLYGDIYYIDEFLANYRSHNGNETSRNSIKDIMDDDKNLILNIKKYNLFTISKFDYICHRCVYFLRAFARKVFLIIKT